MDCPHCGGPAKQDSRFCPHCGKSLRGSDLEELYKPVRRDEPSSAFTPPPVPPSPQWSPQQGPPQYPPPPPYGAPPYGAPPYGAPPYGDPYAPYGYAPVPQFSYAGFWKRLAALLIDGVVLAIPNVALFFLMVPFDKAMNPGQNPFDTDYMLMSQLFNLVSAVISIAYYTFMESSSTQATLGKMALGIIVVDMEGRRISFARALGRSAGKIISGCTCYIGFIMAGFTQRKQGLHDIMAGCLVVDK